MKRLAILIMAIALCAGLILATTVPAQDSEHPEDDGHDDTDDSHDTNETHHEEYHDPWMNIYISGGVVIVFMMAVVFWPKK